MKSSRTCVVVPNVDFPYFSQVVVCFQVKLVQASTLKSSAPLQVARSTLIHTVETDADVSGGSCSHRESNLHVFSQTFSLAIFFSLDFHDLLLACGQS